ncbi:MAG: glycosyltransferase family 4 protein [Deltaproteobacteria bacterium]|nr:MAG: glycosyltransferase family 4 protein [Deltaproteobacteria bacterium]
MRSPHVAYVCADRGVPVIGTKGGSTHIRELVNALTARGAEVRVLAARPTDGESRSAVRADVIDVGSDRFGRLLRTQIRRVAPGPAGEVIGSETLALLLNQDVYQRLQRLHARWHIDVIYERYSLWGHAALRFARDHSIPFLLEVNAPLRLEQAQYRALHNGVVAEALEAQLFQLADRVLVPSSALRDYVIGQGARPGRVRIVCNAADPGIFRSVPRAMRNGGTREQFVIGFVGSLKPWHGIQDLLRAFVRLRRRSAAYRLLIVGDGPLRPAIEQIRRREGLTDAIRVTGNVDYARVPALVAEMDVALAPYPRLTAFYFSPLKVYEYMAAGVPIVASAIGQVTEILTHRRTALLHPAGSINKIVDHIEELHASPRLAARLARAARHLAVKKYTWDRNAARVLAMIATLHRQIREGRYAPAEEPAL